MHVFVLSFMHSGAFASGLKVAVIPSEDVCAASLPFVQLFDPNSFRTDEQLVQLVREITVLAN